VFWSESTTVVDGGGSTVADVVVLGRNNGRGSMSSRFAIASVVLVTGDCLVED